MILQPLVENALLHGLRDREAGGRVRIRANERDGRLTVAVEDDGVGPGRSSRHGTGTVPGLSVLPRGE